MESRFMFDAAQLRARYNPDGSRLRSDQLELLRMLQHVAEICREHDIKWWLSSGTLLGAARHKGFIPWDDDIDIGLPREDYDRFKQYWMQNPSEVFFYQDFETEKNHPSIIGNMTIDT